MKNLFFLLFAISTSVADVIRIPLQLNPDAVKFRTEDSWVIVELQYQGNGFTLLSTTEPGKPLLPVISGNVLIPADARLKTVRINNVTWQELGVGFKVYPAQPMRPISRFDLVGFTPPDPAVYNSTAAYPGEIISEIPAGNKAGFKIAGFIFCPFRYYPANGKLLVASRAEVTVEFETDSAPVISLTPGQASILNEDVAQLVVNHQDISRFSPPVVETDQPEVDVVIVTSSTLLPAVESFASYLKRKGYFTELVATETIYARYPGRDNPEKIRNLFKELFTRRGLKYAILAGDVQHVPHRTGYLPYSPYYVPADLYFSDLDGTWDANNNNLFGEYSYTNFNPDSVDLYSDIVVSRLPFDDATNCANFLHKDTLYERRPDTTYLHRALLPFEELWANIDYYGRIINKNIALALSELTSWLVDSVYNMTPAQCVAKINAGRHLFHFAGHGSYSAFGSTFSTSHLASLTNSTMPVIVNSMACDCGNFDQYDCLGEQFINTPNRGAVSTCLNARYGWGAPPNMGPSENLCMEFYNNYVKGFNQGRAYTLAKDFYRNAAFSQMTYRWSVYGWTLQGDPTMLMWRRIPRQLTVQSPETIPAQPQVLTVRITDLNAAPIAGARVAVLHCNNLLGRGVTNSSGIARVVIPTVGDTWTLLLSVTSQDCAPYEKPIYTRSGRPAPMVVYRSHQIEDPNGRLDPGETAALYITVENLGNLSSTRTTATLHSNSPFVTIIDSTAEYGTVEAGDTVTGDPYSVQVNRNCPHGTRIEMRLKINSESGTWESQFEILIGMPYARRGIWAVHDTGNFVSGVCANGGIGTTTWRGQGIGLIYPKNRAWSSSAMMHGSFLLGISYPDTFWVADNYYGIPWQTTSQDFAVVESIQSVIPPELGDQEYIAIFSDALHPDPKGLTVTQRSFVSARSQHKDFMILEYRIHNNDTAAITNLWSGVACDFRTAPWNSNDELDYAGTDTLRSLAYVRSSPETLALGVRLIYPREATGYANCIYHNTYINDGFTKGEKIRFLDGRLRSVSGAMIGNWHAFVSAGPFTIHPGDSQIVAFVICGGRTVNQLLASSDTAYNWYEPQVGIREKPLNLIPPVTLINLQPRIFTRSVNIRYELNHPTVLPVKVFDATGRLLEEFKIQPVGTSGLFNWYPSTDWRGIIFLQIGENPPAKLLRM